MGKWYWRFDGSLCLRYILLAKNKEFHLLKATDLPNWMKSAVQRGDSWREMRWVNKERPSPPGGGVNCNNMMMMMMMTMVIMMIGWGGELGGTKTKMMMRGCYSVIFKLPKMFWLVILINHSLNERFYFPFPHGYCLIWLWPESILQLPGFIIWSLSQ